MRFEMKKAKSGVSLVTVLLFMLVATIAATATYKWLTSESRSSASRMMQQEAYQSALAGIESARAWMTFNANETGAIIKQYKEGNNAPIKITDRLAEFVRVGQSFDVYLVGASTPTTGTYKLKIISEGTSRNGSAKHRETAILNVVGLYQVKDPEPHNSKPLPFNYAYFGGSYDGAGDVTLSSALINGNWKGNPQEVTGNFIVTGNATLTGNNATVGELACIGGNLGTENHGLAGKDLYVAGNVAGNMELDGDAYFEGDVRNQDGGKSEIKGSVTLNGTLRPLASLEYKIKKNLCTTEQGVVVSTSTKDANDKVFRVEGNVWMPGNQNLWWGRVAYSGCTCEVVTCTCDYYGWTHLASSPCPEVTDYEYMIDKRTCSVSGTTSCNYGSSHLISCENKTLAVNDGGSGDEGFYANYNFYEKIHLGSLDKSEIYIKTMHPWSDYSGTLRGTDYYFTQTPDENKPRACKTDVSQTVCNNIDNGWSGTHYPYPERTTKDHLYYIYYMPSGQQDVGFGSYQDDHWKGADGNYMTFTGYVINFPTGTYSKPYSFTTSNHSQDANHTTNVAGKGYYRYLNHNGTEITGSPYCRLTYNTAKSWQPVCGVTPWFKAEGKTVTSTLPSAKPFSCAEQVKKDCSDHWNENDSRACDGSKYFVEDPLVTAKTTFEPYANKGCAANFHLFGDTYVPQAGGNFVYQQRKVNGELQYNSVGNPVMEYKEVDAGEGDYVKQDDKDFIQLLNDCYWENYNDDDKREENLYNDFLVVKLYAGDDAVKQGETELNGKFIFIIKDPVYTSFFNVANDESYAFYYLENGVTAFVETGTEKALENTFIYSEGQIGTGNNFNLKGTIYATAASCSGMGKLQNSSIEFDQDLVDFLNGHNIICPSGTTCGGKTSSNTSAETSSSGGTSTTNLLDAFYISVAPQISVTLESQYKSNETVDLTKAPNPKGYFVVLPRIIYLTKDSKGTLDHYYNVLTMNTSKAASISTVSCNKGLSPNNLTNMAEGTYTCTVEGSVESNDGTTESQSVVLWVKVKGDGNLKPTVNFVNPSEEVPVGASTIVKLTMPTASAGNTQTCQVTVTPESDPGWELTKADDASIEGSAYKVTVTSGEEVPVVTVKNTSSVGGSVTLTITDAGECSPGAPAVIFNSSTARITRKEIGEYCSGPGASTSECAAGGEYQKKAAWPNCDYDEVWVTADGSNCQYVAKNESWNCGITSDVSLTSVNPSGIPQGCEIVIPPFTIEADPKLDPNKDDYYLYASLKQVPMTFHAGFDHNNKSVEGDPEIVIDVDGPGDYSEQKRCSYTDYNNETSRPAECDVTVYHGSVVSLSLNPEKPKNFNYWKCEEGSDCVDNDPHPEYTFQLTVAHNNNEVHAHFNENDNYCFFDEFRDSPEYEPGIRMIRETILCGNGTDYCIDNCNSNEGCDDVTTYSFANAKWRFVKASTAGFSDLVYSNSDARIGINSSATRGKNESEKGQAIIMSTVKAGPYGTLKAQFEPPSEGTTASQASVKKSGFILRSNVSVESYLMLNIFIGNNGSLKARLCLNGGDKCSTKDFNYSPGANHIVLMSAKIEAKENKDVLDVDVYNDAWSKIPHSVSFDLTNDVIDGVETTALNERVGYSLSHQKFRVYGVGWKSDTYHSECWDTYPTLSCSFKAAYPAGIVEEGKDVTPWVGFSAWYETTSSCTKENIQYWYKGEDGGSNCPSNETDYGQCSSKWYQFEGGAHGYVDNGVEKKMARVSIENCLYNANAAWGTNGVAATCGSFWVGQMNTCTRNHTFAWTANGDDGVYYGLQQGTANLRGADLVVNIDNPNQYNVEIYVFSQNSGSGYTYGSGHIYSLPYQTKQTGELKIPIDALSSVEGFDPEKIKGVYVKTLDDYGSVTVNSIMSSCPKAVKITECSAEFKNNKWLIKANVENAANGVNVKTMEIVSTVSMTPDKMGCDNTSNVEQKHCGFTGSVYEESWPDNPYQNSGSKYKFTITLTDIYESAPVTCETEEQDAPQVVGKCNSITKTVVYQGDGLPQFKYAIENCPEDSLCGYKVELVGPDGFEMMSSSSIKGLAPTATDAANIDPYLTPGKYKFKLSSVGTRPFTACTSDEFEIKKEGTISATSCTFNTVAAGKAATLAMDGIENVRENTEILISRTGGTSVTGALTKDQATASIPLGDKTPSEAGDYSYTVTYVDSKGNTQEICSATLSVVQGLACPNDLPATIRLNETIEYKAAYGGECTSSGFTGDVDVTGSQCSGTYTLSPQHVDNSLSFTYTANGSLGEFSCEGSVTVLLPVPEFSCPENWTGTVGSNVTFDPGSSLKYCSSDYPCELAIDGVTKSTEWAGPTYTWKDDDASKDKKKYKISLKNAHNDNATEHECNITYTSGCQCVAFVNGVGGGYGSCYNSGLDEMETGKCYAINPDRKPVTDDWINQKASDAYWWTEVSCTNWTGCSGGGTSSSPVASSSSVVPASSGSVVTSSSVETNVIANDVWEFTKASGTEFCFVDHPVKNDWQTKAHIRCESGNNSNGHVTLDGTEASDGWQTVEITVDLDADQKYSGCHTASR